jgi:hypothetical protein
VTPDGLSVDELLNLVGAFLTVWTFFAVIVIILSYKYGRETPRDTQPDETREGLGEVELDLG